VGEGVVAGGALGGESGVDGENDPVEGPAV
jgi:hypothetical protein